MVIDEPLILLAVVSVSVNSEWDSVVLVNSLLLKLPRETNDDTSAMIRISGSGSILTFRQESYGISEV